MSASDMRWDDLRTFLAIARGGSLNAASRELGVNHSTVWRRLGALEEGLGATLFDRPGYELTPVGEAMLERAERVEDEMNALLRHVEGHDREPVGTVRVATTGDLVDLVMPHLAAFRARHPRIVVELLLGERLVDLERREADVALRPTLDPPEHAVGRRVADLAWGIYGADPDAPWVVFTDDLAHLAAVRWWSERWSPVEPSLRVSSVGGMAAAVRAGLGRGLLPAYVGDALPGVRRLEPLDPAACSRLWLLVHADLRRTARVRTFVDFLYEQLTGEAARIEGLAGVGAPE